jgi:hypothetical protein
MLITRGVEFSNQWGSIELQVHYVIGLTSAQAAKSFPGVDAGAPLPAVKEKQEYQTKATSRLADISGTTTEITVPREASGLRRLDHGAFNDSVDTFKVERVWVPDSVGAGAHDGQCWLAFHEPSTTGWDHHPSFDICTSEEEAAKCNKREMKAAVDQLKDNCREIGLDNDELEQELAQFRRVQVSELFNSLEPGNRRSNYFRRHYGNTDLYCDGRVQTDDGVRSVCIYYHYASADAMDGCGNPEMEQIWWAQPFQVQRTKLGADTRKLVEEDTALPQMQKKCAACGSAEEGQKCCGKCGLVTYCSKKCQMQHWKKGHKDKCCR